MKRLLAWFVGLLAGIGTSAAFAACPAGSSIRDWVEAGPLCLAATTYGAETAGKSPALVIVLHGDASGGGAADYHYDFARTLVRPGLVAVALLRPGYSDRNGRASEGQDFGRRDHYTAEYINAVGTAIETLKKEYAAARVVLVGHSGGSAYAGVLIGSKPGIADGAVLVSCPCDVKRWREQRGGAWTRSLSPSNVSAKVPASTRIVAITGSNDDNTAPQLAQDYVAGLAKRGVKASFVSVAGAGHSFSRPLQEAAAGAVRDMLP